MKLIRFLFILFIGVLGNLSAQSLPPGFLGGPPINYQSYIKPQRMVVGVTTTLNPWVYQRYPGPNLYYLATGNPTLGLGLTGSASATFESKLPTFVSTSPLFMSQEYKTTLSSSFVTHIVTLNAFALFDDITLIINIPTASVGIVTINIALGLPTSSSGVAFSSSPNYFFGSSTPNRKLTLKIVYATPSAVGVTNSVSLAFWVPASNWGVANSGATTNMDRIPILWPGGESPVFSRVVGGVDVVHLYWSGRGWPIASSPGTCYGIASIGYN